MQQRFFTVPLRGGESVTGELNRFLASHRILAVDRQLGHDGSTSVSAICVSDEPAGGEGVPSPRRGRVDYKVMVARAAAGRRLTGRPTHGPPRAVAASASVR